MSKKNLFDDCDNLQAVLGQLAGYASGCWENLRGAGVFNSSAAGTGVLHAEARIKELYEEGRI